jgi:hypothetical protein
VQGVPATDPALAFRYACFSANSMLLIGGKVVASEMGERPRRGAGVIWLK